MQSIEKYELPDARRFELHLPEGAEILYVGLDLLQRICFWARSPDVDDINWIKRDFRRVKTGIMIPDNEKYIGTVRRKGLLLHFFEVTK